MASPDVKLLPLRNYDEKDTINGLFAWSGEWPVNAGTIVKIQSGWQATDELGLIGDVGASYPNTVSEQWGLPAKVTLSTTGANDALGMLLYDGKIVDENGEQLKFRARKAAEMEVFISGQSCPVVTKGQFLLSGIVGTPSAGALAYTSGGFVITANPGVGSTPIGKFLGPKDTYGNVLVKLDL